MQYGGYVSVVGWARFCAHADAKPRGQTIKLSAHPTIPEARVARMQYGILCVAQRFPAQTPLARLRESM